MRLPAQLLRRKRDSNKGDFGHILIIAGSPRYSGAAVLTAKASLRSGAGLVTLAIPKSLNNAVIKIKPLEAMILPLPETRDGFLSLSGFKKIADFPADVIAIGPGLDRDKSTFALARKVISKVGKPMVIDADGLTALNGHLKILRAGGLTGKRATIMTPHPGEMARLLKVNVKEVQKNRKSIAARFAKIHKVTLVLKGANTIVADHKGSAYINKTGNPGMSTAGCGDVLTGMIAAFLGQGLSAFDAAKYGVYLQGLAGDIAAKEKTQISLIASDIIAKIPEAIKRCS